jgi:hypothetical protein
MRRLHLARFVVLGALVIALLAQVPSLGFAAPNANACWGQATQVFARTGVMGEHASEQATPRLGLRNLARALYEEGIIADDSMAALGAFVADALGLSIDACR